jgi:SpoVK/Ycf46/Vps4 family AAA+-type ATPase
VGKKRSKKRKSSAPSERKWSERGRATGDFISAFIISIIQNTIGFFIWFIKGIISGISAIFKRVKKAKESNNKEEPAAIPEDRSTFKPIDNEELEKITFDNIVGLEEAKLQIRQRIILPIKHKKKAEMLKISKGGGVLLIGPPGNGKTLLAKAVANMVKAAFFHITPGDLVSQSPGVSERHVHDLFAVLRSYKLSVLFMDDVEAMLPSRKKNTSTIMKRIVSQYLIEMQGLQSHVDDNTLLVIAATNEPEMIDPAVMRTGRFDERIFVNLPGIKERDILLRNSMEGILASDDIDFERLASITRLFSCADLTTGLVESAKRAAFDESTKLQGSETVRPVCMEDFLTVLEKSGEPSVGIDKLRGYGVDVDSIV